ncbi:MAG: non-canonical purine NTP pyrophosphatase [bacterium]|nr:non-canonical purine NTP pyrophosphatase [bacterium]
MSKQIIFVTGNEMKVRHANEALVGTDFELIAQKVDIIEPRAEDPKDVVVEKALQAIKLVNKPLIVEDSGIFIEYLNGFPKTFVHFAEETIGVKNIVKIMEGVENRNAEFRQSLAYIESNMTKPIVFSYVDGNYTIANKVWEPQFEDTGDFDKILIPQGENKPLCMFDKEWRAKRDVEANKETIHYRQLAKWLSER